MEVLSFAHIFESHHKPMNLITVAEARQIIAHTQLGLPHEVVSLDHATGKVLAEDLKADRDFPPFDRVTMDGIAIAYAALQGGQRSFDIQEVAAAGTAQVTLDNPQACIEIMTGAVLPKGTDTVIRYEDLNLAADTATLHPETFVKAGQNVHRQGEDGKTGDTLVPSGVLLGAAEIGVAATVGKPELLVKAMPRVAIISTGDELVPIAASPLPHQIRSSNVHSLYALLKQWGLSPTLFHLQDDLDQLRERLNIILSDYPLVVLSGGVSKGKYDYVPQVLDELGIKRAFHKVKQRPGKPFWFGNRGHQNVVFALPGNPVSSFMCAVVYLKHWLGTALGSPTLPMYAQLATNVSFKPSLTYFMPVRLTYDPSGMVMAYSERGNGSGDLANLTRASAFLELPANRTEFQIGEVFPVHPYCSYP